MSSGFGELTTQAHELVAAGDLTGAQELLGDALLSADPSPYHATPELAEAADLQARLLLALGDAEAAYGWAAFAHAADSHLHGPADQRTVAAAATLAAILHRIGDHSRAALLYRDVIIELTANDGPESLRVLAAHADLATVEYARGECELARNRLVDAWELHREVYGDGHLGGIKMLARLAAMERDCGEIAKAHQHFALAQQLCRENLPADHPLATQVDTLAATPANPRHVCGDDAATTDDGTGPPTRADDDPAPYAMPAGDAYAAPATYDPYAVPARDRFIGSAPAYDRHDGTVADDPGAVGDDRAFPGGSYDDRYDEPTPRQEPVTGWQSPAPASSDWPYGSGGPGAIAPADVFTTDVFTPADRSTALAPGAEMSRREHQSSSQGARHLPQRRQPAKPPVPIYHPPSRTGRRSMTTVVAGLTVVVLGATAVIAGFTLVGGTDPDPDQPVGTPTSGPSTSTAPRPSAAPSNPPAAKPGSPPTAVTLRDTRDNVTLTWKYPTGAEGPVVVSGGRAGQQQSAFEQLPAGTTRFIVYGLNKTTDYCFTVTVVYSADTVGRSKPVCTTRSKRSN